MVSGLNFGSRGPRFESRWRLNSAHDSTARHCTESFIITLSWSQYDLYNVERDVKHQTIVLFSRSKLLIGLMKTLESPKSMEQSSGLLQTTWLTICLTW